MRIGTRHRDRGDGGFHVCHHQLHGGADGVGGGGLTVLFTGHGDHRRRDDQIGRDAYADLHLPHRPLLVGGVARLHGGIVLHVVKLHLLLDGHLVDLRLGVPVAVVVLLVRAGGHDTAPVRAVVAHQVVIVAAAALHQRRMVGGEVDTRRLLHDVHPQATVDGDTFLAVGRDPLKLVRHHAPALGRHAGDEPSGEVPRVDAVVHLDGRGILRGGLKHDDVLLVGAGAVAHLHHLVANAWQIAACILMRAVAARVHRELDIVMHLTILELSLAHGRHQSPPVGVLHLVATIKFSTAVHICLRAVFLATVVAVVESHVGVVALTARIAVHLLLNVKGLAACLCAHRPVQHRSCGAIVGIEVAADGAHGGLLFGCEAARQALAPTQEPLGKALGEQTQQPAAHAPGDVVVVITKRLPVGTVPFHTVDLARCGAHAEVTADAAELPDLQLVEESLLSDRQVVESGRRV